MKYRQFEDLLEEFRQCEVPSLPGSFASDVLREIRLRSAAEHEAGLLPSLLALFRPSLLAASLSVAIAVGVVLPGMVLPADQSPTVSSLDLNVFSAGSSYFPSGLLAKTR